MLLQKIGLKMLVIDEAHQLLAGSYREQRRALSLLKGLTNPILPWGPIPLCTQSHADKGAAARVVMVA